MASKGAATTKLFVGNLPIGIQQEELENMFAEYGKVLECDIVRDYAFVHFADANEAKAAATGLDQTMYKGVTIKVQLSHSKVRPKPGMGDRDKCYRCGQEGHWSKECPTSGGGGGPMTHSRRGGRGGGGGGYMMGGGAGGYPSMAAAAAAPSMGRYHPYMAEQRRPPAPVAQSFFQMDEYGRPTPEYYAQRISMRGAYDYTGAAPVGRAPLAATSYPFSRREAPQY